MSLFVAASRRVSVFRGMAGAIALILAVFVMVEASAVRAADAPAATSAPAAQQLSPPPGAPAAVAIAVPPAVPPGAQATMSITWPMPSFGAGAPPQIIEPVAMVACRQCRDSCFRDYGAQCNDDSCRRALPLCMRNCWQAICR